MLLAYIDEIGEAGAFISHNHPRYNTSPAFGYAGFILPEGQARAFGSLFTDLRHQLFRNEIEQINEPHRWERKGASMFRETTAENYPQYLRLISGLVQQLRRWDGRLFYYANEKPCGTPGQTKLDAAARETMAMRETLNRIARYADNHGQNVLVMVDQVNEKERTERIGRMYAHIFSRANEYPEMRRVVEPPMHIDSRLSSNIQFADWTAAIVSRAADYQLIRDSKHRWVTLATELFTLKGSFTYESKLHLSGRSVADLNHSEILNSHRALYPHPVGHSVGELIDPKAADKMRKVFETGRSSERR